MSGEVLTVVGRARRVRCKMCLESRVMEVDTWDDRVEFRFEHDCRARGPRLSNPVTRDGQPVPFFPVGRRILVERLPEDAKVGSIIIPEIAKQTQVYATLVAAGPKAQDIIDDMGIQIGDIVSFGKFSTVGYEWFVQIDGRTETRKVDQMQVDDIFGCRELAEKMIDGRMGIALHVDEKSSLREYRFFELVGPKDAT